MCYLKREWIKIPIATTRAFSLAGKPTDLDYTLYSQWDSFFFSFFFYSIIFFIVNAEPDDRVAEIKYVSCSSDNISRLLKFLTVFIII